LHVLLLAAAAVAIPGLEYFLYSMPPQVKQIGVQGAPLSGDDANVYLIVSNCGRYANWPGIGWWKHLEVDYRACASDPATVVGIPTVVGQFRQPGDAQLVRAQSTWACVSCKQDLQLDGVAIPLGTRPEEAATTVQLPLNLRLSPVETLQIVYSPRLEQRYAGATEQTYPMPGLIVH
jgi:hypothetical protein